MSAEDQRQYILKDLEATELDRLKYQHQVWLEETFLFCQKAGFGPEQTLLDLGCGPGYLSEELSKRVEPGGRVIAADNSKKFIDFLNSKSSSSNTGNITTLLTDIQNMPLAPASLDGAVARWVMMFLGNVNAVIQNVSQALKPNGVFAIMEYFHFRSMSLWPQNASFEKVYHAVYKLIAQSGGDADIGADMAQRLTEHGFAIKTCYPVFRIGHPGSELWKWLEITAKNHHNLVSAGLITQTELEEYFQDWADLSKNPNSFFTAPPLMVTIGVKR